MKPGGSLWGGGNETFHENEVDERLRVDQCECALETLASRCSTRSSLFASASSRNGQEVFALHQQDRGFDLSRLAHLALRLGELQHHTP